jgi:ligand-binding sensor domain-containing protein
MSGSNLFAGTDTGGVFLSTDSGTSWTSVNSGLPAKTIVLSLAVSGIDLYAGTDTGGVFLSTDSGTSWTPVNAGLPAKSKVLSLAVFDGSLYAGIGGCGVWRRPVPEMVGVINPKLQQGMFQQATFKMLSPRHADRTTIIACSLPRPEKVTFTVCDLSGHDIASLGNKIFEAGLHQIPWDTRNVAAGFYLIRMNAGSNGCVKYFPIIR